MSELKAHIKALIAEEGPISVERYMEMALAHPDFGYYMNRDPFGASGDFTTAPEITQMFGELIGLWSAEVWAMMGRPDPLRFIELGPGRGTLMSDALRAARIAPEFRAALDVTLVETSPTLAEIQHDTLLTAGAPIAWAPSISETPEGPAIFIANEFLDALPIRQYVRSNNRWRERMVWVDKSGELAFTPGRQPEPFIQGAGEEGDIVETCPAAHRLVYELSGRLVRQGGLALLIDYGHSVTSVGDTLQALRGHRIVDPLREPGDCDITAHVDFAAMARSARAAGAAVYGPVDQGDFLRDIGIDTRTRALAERTPERAEEFEQARRRLVGKDTGEMGGLFKAMVIANRSLPAPPGFEDAVIKAPVLEQPGIVHAFFTREGGVSEGVYATLNGGVGSSDRPEAVAENRARMARALGLEPQRLLVPYQVHSPDVVTVSEPWTERPRCDGIVTATPGLALGVTGADCGMVLFADAEARVVGACHAGWKGARDGVVEATVAAMVALGASAGRIVAALGPCIAQASYEVGPEFVAAFADDAEAARYFIDSRNAGRSMFDLHGYIGLRAARAGVGRFVDLGLDTYADEERFFSYRRKTHRGEADYGRLVSAIALI